MTRRPGPRAAAGALTPCADSFFTAVQRNKDENGRANRSPPRVIMDFPKNMPITQIEIEVVAALLDDCESLFPAEAEAQKDP